MVKGGPVHVYTTKEEEWMKEAGKILKGAGEATPTKIIPRGTRCAYDSQCCHPGNKKTPGKAPRQREALMCAFPECSNVIDACCAKRYIVIYRIDQYVEATFIVVF